MLTLKEFIELFEDYYCDGVHVYSTRSNEDIFFGTFDEFVEKFENSNKEIYSIYKNSDNTYDINIHL